MKNLSMPTRVAVTGVAGALAAATLIGVTTTPAQAATITNTYSCEGTSGPFPVSLESTIDLSAFPTIPAGFAAPGGALQVLNTFTVPSAVITTMSSFGITRLESPDFAGNLGANKVGVDGVEALVSSAVDNGDGTHSFDANGINAAFEIPRAGAYDVVGPTDFDIDAYNTNGAKILGVPCTLTGANGSYHSLTVFKNESATTGKPVAKTLKTTKAAKMKVAVTASNKTPAGKVLVKEGDKTLGKGTLTDDGLATIAMGKLKKGKHTVKVVYGGSGYTEKSTSEKITFKVIRP